MLEHHGKIHYKWTRKIIEIGDILAILDSQRVYLDWIPRVDSGDIM
jgi:hypothetical protein